MSRLIVKGKTLTSQWNVMTDHLLKASSLILRGIAAAFISEAKSYYVNCDLIFELQSASCVEGISTSFVECVMQWVSIQYGYKDRMTLPGNIEGKKHHILRSLFIPVLKKHLSHYIIFHSCEPYWGLDLKLAWKCINPIIFVTFSPPDSFYSYAIL